MATLFENLENDVPVHQFIEWFPGVKPEQIRAVRGACSPQRAGRSMRYLVVVEEGASRFGAYVPDLPGCVAVASSRAEVMQLSHEVIELPLEDSREQGLSVPSPHSSSELVEVHA